MQYHFKPLDNLQSKFLWPFYIFPILPLNIGCILVCLKQFNVPYFVICTIFTITPILIFILVRLFYPYKYIIDDRCITKYKRREVVFRIERKRLKTILVKKARVADCFKFFALLLNGNYSALSTSHITTMSFVFDVYEVFIDDKATEFKRLPLNENLYPNCFEYVEIASYRKIKKIAKTLGIDLQII